MKLSTFLSVLIPVLCFIVLVPQAEALDINGNHPNWGGNGSYLQRNDRSPTGYAWMGGSDHNGGSMLIAQTCGEKCKGKDLTCTVTADRTVIEQGDSTRVKFTIDPPAKVRYDGGKYSGSIWYYSDDNSEETLAYIGYNASSVSVNLSRLTAGVHEVEAWYRIGRIEHSNAACNHNGGADGTGGGCSDLVYVHDTYTCSTPITVTSEDLTECNDGIDNDDLEDELVDTNDPGCHTDGDPKNPETYDPTDDDEENGPPNLVAGIQVLKTPLAPGSAGQFRLTWSNTEPIAVRTPTARIVTWKQKGSAADPDIWYFAQGTYGPAIITPTQQNYVRTSVKSFAVPSTPGLYEACFIVDAGNQITESNETDNIACTDVEVKDDATASVSLDIRKKTSGNNAPWRQSVTIRDDEEAELRLIPDNMQSCTATNFNFAPGKASYEPQRIDLGLKPVGAYTFEVECDDTQGDTYTDTATLIVNNLSPLTLEADPPLVRRGETTDLVYDLGGRTSCTLSGGGMSSTPVTGTGEQHKDSPAILGETTFTLTCTDDGASATAKVRVLPAIDEF